MGIKEFFSSRAETSENHNTPELKTRYYKTTRTSAMKMLKQLIDAMPELELLDYAEERGEINAQYIGSKKAYLVASIITVFPYRTAIDFTIITKTSLPTDFGYSKQEVLKWYRKLDKSLEFVGVSLSGEQNK
jgi:hypothetical protein